MVVRPFSPDFCPAVTPSIAMPRALDLEDTVKFPDIFNLPLLSISAVIPASFSSLTRVLRFSSSLLLGSAADRVTFFSPLPVWKTTSRLKAFTSMFLPPVRGLLTAAPDFTELAVASCPTRIDILPIAASGEAMAENALEEEYTDIALKKSALLRLVEEVLPKKLSWNLFRSEIISRYFSCCQISFCFSCSCLSIFPWVPDNICSTQLSVSIPEIRPDIPLLVAALVL